MRKNVFLLFVLSGFFIISTSGCTSKNVDEGQSDVSELTDAAPGDAEKKAEGGAAENTDDVAALEDDFGAETSTPPPPPAEGAAEGENAEAKAETKADTGAEVDDFAATDNTKSEQSPAPEQAPATPEPLPPEDLSAGATTDTSSAAGTDEMQGLAPEPTQETVAEPAPPPAPLHKMVTAPYKKAGVIVNALYVARKGDTLKSVSQKIYGENKTKELKKINPVLARRSLKVGDKVYYNSPKRPTDETTVLTYYEDMGLTPEVYTALAGDNIRTVSKKLLGHANSWKEVWVTNLEVESKGELTEGTRLRYWSSAVEATTTPPAMATTGTEVPPMGAEAGAAPATVMNEPPPAPMPEEAAPPAGTPPPPPMEAAAPPPPMPEEAAPPAGTPPPPPMEATPPQQAPHKARPVAPSNPLVEILGTDDPDQLMTLGAGAVLLLAAIAMFIIIRKKRRRNMPVDFQTATHTRID